METETVESPRTTGSAVADFELITTDGKTCASKAACQNSLVLIAMFKTGCGTCKYSFPYLQRFQERYVQPSDGRFQVWGISQDNAEQTQTFAREYGNATFPLLLDSDLRVTSQYGITHVPDLYLLGKEETILAAVLGHFGRDAYNGLAGAIATYLGVPYAPIVTDEDNAPALKPG